MRLIAYLKKNKKTQVQFAEELGMTKQMLGARIKGRTQWKPKEIQKVQEKTEFQVSLTDLLDTPLRKKD